MRRRRQGDSDLRPVPMIDALNRYGVRYVVIGSYAAIAQGVDLDITDLDIVPALDPENCTKLAGALKDLHAREKVGGGTESTYDLFEDPSTITDFTFREFVTDFGKIDVVMRPAAFPRGFDDLVERAVIAHIRDDEDPDRGVDMVVAERSAVYESKRSAARGKDIAVLRKFVGLHPTDVKEAMREKYRAQRADHEKQ